MRVRIRDGNYRISVEVPDEGLVNKFVAQDFAAVGEALGDDPPHVRPRVAHAVHVAVKFFVREAEFFRNLVLRCDDGVNLLEIRRDDSNDAVAFEVTNANELRPLI